MWDNGIGMSRADVVENIGTIARSGTREFLQAVRDQKGQVAPELIGQFGVGFYSSFMVADRIVLVTRKAGEETATRWESTGDGYALDEAERATPGTTVTLHLKPKDEEDGLRDYTDEHVLRDIVRKYSDFVAYPVRLKGDTLNSMKAIWARPKEEVSEEQYREFYKHLTHDWNDPLEHVLVHVEGTVEARALLYVPSKAPMDLFMREGERRGVQLYVKRVFIMDDWEALLPPWLRFVRGVVASDDLSLNVSREILQKDRQIQAIRKHLARRLLGALKEMKEQRADKYRTFWPEFGAVLKEGLLGLEDNQDRILDAGAGGIDGRARRAHVAGRLRLAHEGRAGGHLLHDGRHPERRRALTASGGLPRQGIRGAVLHRSRGRAVAAPEPRVRGQEARVGGRGVRHAGGQR